MKNIICDVCGSLDWNLKGDKEGIILLIDCKNCHNNIINLEDKVKNL